MKNWIHLAALALAASFLPQPYGLSGQGLEETLFTVGTTLEDADSDGQAWSYLLWQAEDLEQLKGRVFAIYSKEGTPGSPGPYIYEGTARTRFDPAAILALVNRGEALGDDPVELESNINSLFEELIPDVSLPLAQKIAAVVDGALADPELYENLIFLSRSHPSISLIIGTAFAVQHPDGQVRTFEIRECVGQTTDPDGDCEAVTGRVTLKVGIPRVLPAPGEPVWVPFTDASGNPDPRAHLNVPLRWATPDSLREVTLLQFGYNIYRMTEADALADNFDATPPDPLLLEALVADPGHSATRVNTVPVLIERFLGALEAEDTVTDPETFFYIDDNNRFDPGGVPFVNGDIYYYFVTANDILGRDGEVSQGTKVKICDAMPPPQPKKVTVSNHYTFDVDTSINTQHFRVDWEEPDLSDRETPEEIIGYAIYRWLDLEEKNAMESTPWIAATATSGGFVATVPVGTTSYIDNGSQSPFLRMERLGDGSKIVDQTYASKTYWYTVRAIDGSACDGNLSGNSAPAYGVLRDRIGPPRPDGNLLVSCYDLRLVAPKEVQQGRPFEDPPEDGKVYLTLECLRLDTGIDWVEFALYDPLTGQTQSLTGERLYSQGQTTFVYELKRDQPTPQEPLYVACRVGGYGKQSGWNYLQVPYQDDPSTAFYFYWEASSIENQVPLNEQCDTHESVDPDGKVNPITLEFNLTAGTEEWKVYRRIDDGALTLIAQGLDSALGVLIKIVEDLNMPATDARLCYFVQVYDQHGNPSPMARIACVEVTGREALGTPMLTAPEAIGDESDPKASVFWFCPPFGIEYFEMWISCEDGDLPSAIGAAFEPSFTDFTQDGVSWRSFRTGRVPTQFPGNTPEFVVDVEGIKTGKEYTFKVRAIGMNGSEGPFSNEETFIWNPDGSATVSGPNVPWPSLGLVEPQASFNANIKARITNPNVFDGGSVRIGFLDYSGYELFFTGEEAYQFAYPPGVQNPEKTIVFQNNAGDSLLPFVLYRYQVPNTAYPLVSGDVYQVSPMMERIPTTLEVFPQVGVVALLNHDPFVFVALNTDQERTNFYDLLVKDTQPLVSGARYRYLIVRFDERTKEIAEIIPTNAVDIP